MSHPTAAQPRLTPTGEAGQRRAQDSATVTDMTTAKHAATPVRPTCTPDSGHLYAVHPDTPVRRTGHLLRFVPPIAALGTAFVLQTIAITDILGGALADRFDSLYAYIPAAMLGLSVASCAEGGAAYLMDLYDRHLLARDNTWLLRLGMIVYVAASAAGLHWWASFRGLPTIMSWLLAGMSASALFLWSRGSRWQNREAMRAAGQIDPALPRLPMGSKVLHPIRWLVTLWLISWNPTLTTADARARYQAWKDRRSGRTARTEEFVQSMISVASESIAAVRVEMLAEVDTVRTQVEGQAAATLSAVRLQAAEIKAEAERGARMIRTAAVEDVHAVRSELSAVQVEADRIRTQAELYAGQVRTAAESEAGAVRVQAENLYAEAVRVQQEADSRLAEADRLADTRADSSRPVRLVASNGVRRTAGRAAPEVSVEQLADSLAGRFPDTVPGRPKAIEHLKQVFGSCSNDRAREAIRVLSARRGGDAEAVSS